MFKNFKSYLQIAALLAIKLTPSVQFDYCNQGYWIQDSNECGGSKQSPIELNSNEVPIIDLLPPLKFVNYETTWNIPIKIENNGLTVNMEIPKLNNNIPYITGGALPGKSVLSPGKFITDSVHFHWGSSNTHGSEHVINGNRYSMEMHIVHRNSKYSTIDEAVKHPDGLAVVGMLYNVVSETSPARGLTPITDALKDIRNYTQSIEINNFYLSDLIDDLKNGNFYTYTGSLTTPPCSEVVTWHVMSSEIQMSNSQIEAFRAIRGIDGIKVENNYRGLQIKGGRIVRMHKSLLSNIIVPV